MVNSALKFGSASTPFPSVNAAVYASWTLSFIWALSVFVLASVALCKIPIISWKHWNTNAELRLARQL